MLRNWHVQELSESLDYPFESYVPKADSQINKQYDEICHLLDRLEDIALDLMDSFTLIDNNLRTVAEMTPDENMLHEQITWRARNWRFCFATITFLWQELCYCLYTDSDLELFALQNPDETLSGLGRNPWFSEVIEQLAGVTLHLALEVLLLIYPND